MDQEIIIRENVSRNLTGVISRITYQGTELFSIDKTTSSKLKKFLQSKTIYLKMVKGKLVIENIILDGKIKITDASNRVSKNITNRFNVAKSYVATTRKEIVNKCKTFYSSIEHVVNENKLIVDISHEVNLQRELYKSTQPQSDGIRIFNKKLNLNPDFCQKVNEGTSIIMAVSKVTKESLKGNLLALSSKFDASLETKERLNEEIRKLEIAKKKKLVKRNSLGYIPTIIVTVIALIGVLVLSFTITNIMIR